MSLNKQYAILKVVANKQGFGSAMELAIAPLSKEGNQGKPAVFESEYDAYKHVEKLAGQQSSIKYIILPIYSGVNGL